MGIKPYRKPKRNNRASWLEWCVYRGSLPLQVDLPTRRERMYQSRTETHAGSHRKHPSIYDSQIYGTSKNALRSPMWRWTIIQVSEESLWLPGLNGAIPEGAGHVSQGGFRRNVNQAPVGVCLHQCPAMTQKPLVSMGLLSVWRQKQ